MSQKKDTEYVLSIAIIGGLFFIFGFVTWLNGTLIPFLKLACDLKSNAQALLVASAFYMAYFFLAIPSSFILGRTGYKKGMSLGLFIMAIGSFVFIPAALTRNYGLFLAGLFTQGMGLALAQTGANPYISVIGPIESAARRISIMGICNKGAGVISPLILGAILLAGASEAESRINSEADPLLRAKLLQSLTDRVIVPYLVWGLALVVLAAIVWVSPLKNIEGEGNEPQKAGSATAKTSVFQFPHLLLGVICIFVYVGVEVVSGDVIGPYGRALGKSLDVTRFFTSWTLASMLVGYTIGIITIPKFIKQENALKVAAVLGIIFVVLASITGGYASILLIALLGLADSIMWPAIFPLAIDGLGRFTKIGSALLIMGIAGGAIIPQIYARLATVTSPQAAMLMSMLPCYLYILYYSSRGYRAGRHKSGKKSRVLEPASLSS